ncbi:MAG TPA: FixH family protein [Anaerolineales bacterium]|nr:FixH family protein [Anaerolineales bacterium]
MKQPRSKTVRVLLWIGGILGGLLLVFAILAGVMMARMNDVPSDLDYSTTRSSEKGLFNVSYTASTGVVPVNEMHQWTLHVETSNGQIVEDANITVDGDMPQHGHGLPTRPQVTEYLGNGDYLVEGLKFQMGGWWVMDFTITANGQNDAVHFNMMLR